MQTQPAHDDQIVLSTDTTKLWRLLLLGLVVVGIGGNLLFSAMGSAMGESGTLRTALLGSAGPLIMAALFAFIVPVQTSWVFDRVAGTLSHTRKAFIGGGTTRTYSLSDVQEINVVPVEFDQVNKALVIKLRGGGNALTFIKSPQHDALQQMADGIKAFLE